MMQAAVHKDLQSLRKFALTLAGATEDFPFGHSVIKVTKKIFAFLGVDGEQRATIALKLPKSGGRALELGCCKPTGYGLGKSGWVTVAVKAPDAPSIETLRQWILESHAAVSQAASAAAGRKRRPARKASGRKKSAGDGTAR